MESSRQHAAETKAQLARNSYRRSRARVARLRPDLDATVEELKITTAHVKRLVDTVLELDHQQPETPYPDEGHRAEGLFQLPALTKS